MNNCRTAMRFVLWEMKHSENCLKWTLKLTHYWTRSVYDPPPLPPIPIPSPQSPPEAV